MSMLIFGLASEQGIKIDESKMIKTSFPEFKNILNSINAKVEHVQK
jgi:5-enolpyruvylshikimate-3-phosphate synthase